MKKLVTCDLPGDLRSRVLNALAVSPTGRARIPVDDNRQIIALNLPIEYWTSSNWGAGEYWSSSVFIFWVRPSGNISKEEVFGAYESLHNIIADGRFDKEVKSCQIFNHFWHNFQTPPHSIPLMDDDKMML